MKCLTLFSLFSIRWHLPQIWAQILQGCVLLSYRSEYLVTYWYPPDQVLWPTPPGPMLSLKIDFIFLRVLWGSQKNYVANMENSHTLVVYYSHPSESSNILHQTGTIVTINKPTQTYNHYTKSKCSLNCTLNVVHSRDCVEFAICILL